MGIKTVALAASPGEGKIEMDLLITSGTPAREIVRQVTRLLES